MTQTLETLLQPPLVDSGTQQQKIWRLVFLEPILDWSQPLKVNGDLISNLRKQVKQRLLAQGENYKQAAIAKETADKYWKLKKQQYQEYQQQAQLGH